jgi:hypothetical protein
MAELTAGAKAPDIVNVVIEIRRGERNKYEMDKDTGYLTLDRVNATMLGYPADYGYVPQTLCDDGDPLDALLVIAARVTRSWSVWRLMTSPRIISRTWPTWVRSSPALWSTTTPTTRTGRKVGRALRSALMVGAT